jgi:hypothetical protein
MKAKLVVIVIGALVLMADQANAQRRATARTHSDIRHLFRSIRLSSRHRRTFINRARNGINRIQIRVGIFSGREA